MQIVVETVGEVVKDLSVGTYPFYVAVGEHIFPAVRRSACVEFLVDNCVSLTVGVGEVSLLYSVELACGIVGKKQRYPGDIVGGVAGDVAPVSAALRKCLITDSLSALAILGATLILAGAAAAALPASSPNAMSVKVLFISLCLGLAVFGRPECNYTTKDEGK